MKTRTGLLALSLVVLVALPSSAQQRSLPTDTDPVDVDNGAHMFHPWSLSDMWRLAGCMASDQVIKPECMSDYKKESEMQQEARGANRWWKATVMSVAQILQTVKWAGETVTNWKALYRSTEVTLAGLRHSSPETDGALALVIMRSADDPDRYYGRLKRQQGLINPFTSLKLDTRFQLADLTVQKAFAMAGQAEELSSSLSDQSLRLQARLGAYKAVGVLGPGSYGAASELPVAVDDPDNTPALYNEIDQSLNSFLPSGGTMMASAARRGSAQKDASSESAAQQCPMTDDTEDPTVIAKRVINEALGAQLQAQAQRTDLVTQNERVTSIQAAEQSREITLRKRILNWVAHSF